MKSKASPPPPFNSIAPSSRSCLWAACAILLALSSRLHAASVATSTVAPFTDIVVSNTPVSSGETMGWKNDSSANQWAGSTFHVTETLTLDKITLAYASVGTGASAASVSLSIIQIDASASSLSDKITGASILQTDSMVLPSSLDSSGFLTFDITDITLTKSSVAYGFILRFEAPATGRQITFLRGNRDGSGSAAGIGEGDTSFRSENGGTTYATYTLAPHVMYLQGTVSQIPEPSTQVVLIGGSVFALAGIIRSRFWSRR